MTPEAMKLRRQPGLQQPDLEADLAQTFQESAVEDPQIRRRLVVSRKISQLAMQWSSKCFPPVAFPALPKCDIPKIPSPSYCSNQCANSWTGANSEPLRT